jgi:predicted ester cyclase
MRLAICSIFVFLFTSCAAIPARNENKMEEVVKPFYTKCLTVNSETNTNELLGKLLSDNFQSTGSTATKGKEQLIKGVQYLWELIPDMKWNIQEMVQYDNRIVVRSIASGSPKGDFMGLSTDGRKSFKIMTIDIVTVEDDQISQIYHVEDWATAIKQLK